MEIIGRSYTVRLTEEKLLEGLNIIVRSFQCPALGIANANEQSASYGGSYYMV
jgi:hypothetical protein